MMHSLVFLIIVSVTNFKSSYAAGFDCKADDEGKLQTLPHLMSMSPPTDTGISADPLPKQDWQNKESKLNFQTVPTKQSWAFDNTPGTAQVSLHSIAEPASLELHVTIPKIVYSMEATTTLTQTPNSFCVQGGKAINTPCPVKIPYKPEDHVVHNVCSQLTSRGLYSYALVSGVTNCQESSINTAYTFEYHNVVLKYKLDLGVSKTGDVSAISKELVTVFTTQNTESLKSRVESGQLNKLQVTFLTSSAEDLQDPTTSYTVTTPPPANLKTQGLAELMLTLVLKDMVQKSKDELGAKNDNNNNGLGLKGIVAAWMLHGLNWATLKDACPPPPPPPPTPTEAADENGNGGEIPPGTPAPIEALPVVPRGGQLTPSAGILSGLQGGGDASSGGAPAPTGDGHGNGPEKTGTGTRHINTLEEAQISDALAAALRQGAAAADEDGQGSAAALLSPSCVGLGAYFTLTLGLTLSLWA